MEGSRLPAARTLCWEEPVATRTDLQPETSDVECCSHHPTSGGATLAHHQPLDVLLRLKILWGVTACLAKGKKKSPWQKGRGKEKPKHELVSLLWRIKAGFVLLYFTQTKYEQEAHHYLELQLQDWFYMQSLHFAPQKTELFLFLQTTCS